MKYTNKKLLVAIILNTILIATATAQTPFALFPNPGSNTTTIIYPVFNLDNRITKADLIKKTG